MLQKYFVVANNESIKEYEYVIWVLYLLFLKIKKVFLWDKQQKNVAAENYYYYYLICTHSHDIYQMEVIKYFKIVCQVVLKKLQDVN